MEKAALAIYQPLIVGLGAVVLGLIANTLLEWFRHSLNARHQRSVVRRAIAEELKIALNVAKVNRDNLRSNPPTRFEAVQMPIREDYPAFKWATPSLGLLTSREIAAVFVAYDYLNSWPEIIAMIGKMERVEGRLFAYVPFDGWETIALAADDRVRLVQSAVTELTTDARTNLG